MTSASNRRYFCPQCGVDALESVDNKLYGCSRCGHTYFHNTAVAVSAVIERAGKIAWITRAREPGAGLLDLPGGFVERDESLEAAVMRETFEETGFKLLAPRYLFPFPIGMYFTAYATARSTCSSAARWRMPPSSSRTTKQPRSTGLHRRRSTRAELPSNPRALRWLKC